jgi:beta-fructofuranosidase
MSSDLASTIEQANAAVEAAARESRRDPLRPVYHLTTAAQWINDPNGPLHFDGRYHMFFQHNPFGAEWGNMSWGHASSPDLVHWQDHPIALVPTPGGCDKDGVFSGCCVVDDGVPTIVYTGVEPEVQCLATSTDGLETWTKFAGNPVLADKPRPDLHGWRDPYVWREGNTWLMLLGSGMPEVGGAALLYRSKDLKDWEYLHPLCTGFGHNWECPNFFPLDDKHVLIVSPHEAVQYSVGEYNDHRFTPGPWRRMDANRDNFYATHSLEDEQGRRIVWAWITGGGTPGTPWNGVLTLPRVLTLRDDDTIGQAPLPELAPLRESQQTFENINLGPDAERVLDDVQSDKCELIVTLDPQSCGELGVALRRSVDGTHRTEIVFDNNALELRAGNQRVPFQLLPGEDRLTLHIFLDKSVIEVFANGRTTLTCRSLPDDPENAKGISLFNHGGPAHVERVDVWEMGCIWKK